MKTVVTILLLLTFNVGFSQTDTEKNQLKEGDSKIFYITTDMKGTICMDCNYSDSVNNEAIKEMIAFLKENTKWVFEIIYHTDVRGSLKANDKFSQFHAENFKFSLVEEFNIPEWQLIPKGKRKSS